MRSRLAVLVVSALSVACGGCGNVNAPRGNKIGERHADFMRVVAHAKTLRRGRHDCSTLPPELRIKNLLAVHVGSRKVYALEFPSTPMDCNPIYVFVEEGVPDPEGAARGMCGEQVGWYFSRRLDEPGWYYASGP